MSKQKGQKWGEAKRDLNEFRKVVEGSEGKIIQCTKEDKFKWRLTEDTKEGQEHNQEEKTTQRSTGG